MTQQEKEARIIALANKMHIKLNAKKERGCRDCKYYSSLACTECEDQEFWKRGE